MKKFVKVKVKIKVNTKFQSNRILTIANLKLRGVPLPSPIPENIPEYAPAVDFTKIF